MSQEEKRTDIQINLTTVEEAKENTDDCNRRTHVSLNTIDEEMPIEGSAENITKIVDSSDKIGFTGYSSGVCSQTVNINPSEVEQQVQSWSEAFSKAEEYTNMENIAVRALKITNASNKLILINLEQDTDELRQTSQLIPGNTSGGPEFNVLMDNISEFQRLTEIEIMIQQAVEQCLEEIITEVICDFETGIQSLLALKPINTKVSMRKRTPSYEASHSQMPSSSKGCESQIAGQDKVKKEKVKRPDMLKHRACKIELLRAARKDTDIFTSIIEEIERMNDFYRQEILDKNKQIRSIQQFSRHVNENLTILEDEPKTNITIKNETGQPYALINVYEFGLGLYSDLASFLMNTSKLNKEYDEFRIKFHDMSKAFSSIPFENFVGTEKGNVMKSALLVARDIYKQYFEDVKFEFEYELLKADSNKLQRYVQLFDTYIDKLGEQIN